MTSTFAPQPHRRSTARRVVLTAGVALILGGLGFLLFCGWQYFGTNVISKHKQAQVKATLVQDWGKGIDSDAIGLLRVDRFGKNYEQPIVPGFDDAALAKGVGWDTKSAKPGEIGNFAIAAHRVTHGEPFKDFPKLRAGDKVVVETRRFIYTYRLRNGGKDITVDFSVGWPLQRVPDPKMAGQRPTKAVITMLTCSELFHTDNRDVVIGDLIKTVDKSKPRAVETTPAS